MYPNNREDMIRFAVTNSSKTAKQALVLLYQNQTKTERDVGISLENNFIGFDGLDDSVLSHYAEVVVTGHELDDKQCTRLKRMLEKYVSQLVRIEANGVNFPIDQSVADQYKPSTGVAVSRKRSMRTSKRSMSLQDIVRTGNR